MEILTSDYWKATIEDGSKIVTFDTPWFLYYINSIWESDCVTCDCNVNENFFFECEMDDTNHGFGYSYYCVEATGAYSCDLNGVKGKIQNS